MTCKQYTGCTTVVGARAHCSFCDYFNELYFIPGRASSCSVCLRVGKVYLLTAAVSPSNILRSQKSLVHLLFLDVKNYNNNNNFYFFCYGKNYKKS